MSPKAYLFLALSISFFAFIVSFLFPKESFACFTNSDYSAWAYCKTITIDHTKVSSSSSESYTNFPVLVAESSDTNLAAHALSSGNDILFVNASDTAKLNDQIENYNSSTGELEAWVQLPSIATSTNTVFYMYYGNSGASNQQNVTGTWDGTYEGVWHMNDNANTTTVVDSTGANNGVFSENTADRATTGEIAGALSFVTSSLDYIDLGSTKNYISSSTAFTAESWAYLNPVGAGAFPSLMLWKDADGNPWILFFGSTEYPEFQGLNFGSTAGWAKGIVSTPLSTYTGQFHHFVVTYNGEGQGTLSNFQLYVDGSPVTVSALGSPYGALDNVSQIGNNQADVTDVWDGEVDETTISNVARSADWIKTQYNNQSSPNTFLSVSDQQGGDVITTTMTAPTNGSNVSGTVIVSAIATTSLSSISNVQFKLDGVNLGSPQTVPTSGLTYSISWDTTQATSGSHSLTAVATDAQGNTTTTPAIMVTVYVPLAISNATSSVSASSINISWTTNNAADSQVVYSTVSGGPYSSSTPLTDTSPMVTSHVVNLTGLATDIPYYYKVRSNDGTNVSYSAQQSFRISGTDPLVSVSMATSSIWRYNQGYPTKYVNSDVWASTWADDGNIYTASDDTQSGWPIDDLAGGRNIMFSELSSFATSSTGSLINSMDNFGTETQAGSDGDNYKASGLISVSGTLYMWVYRQAGAPDGNWVYDTHGSQLLKSTDHGATWTPQPPSAPNPFASPMFPGAAFSTPDFIQYGQDDSSNGNDNSNAYVYAVANDGSWNNSTHLILGRVKKSQIGDLNANEWSFYIGNGADGMLNSSWGSLGSSTPIITKTFGVSMNGIQYIPAINRYVMIEWYYPSVPSSQTTNDTIWNYYQSPTPWGPWTLFQTNEWDPQGYYNPNIISKSLTTDGGHTVMISTAGDYFSQATSTGFYTLTFVPSTLNTAAPVISSISSSSLSSTSQAITWQTATPTDSQIGYATTSGGPYAYTAVTDTANPVLSHSMILTGLSAQTQYYFVVSDTDAFGSAATSSENIFTTALPSASTYTLTGPSSGEANSASSNFTVTPNNSYTGTITITPTGSASTGLSPIVLTFTNSSAAQTFTLTPTTAGSITLTPSNNGSLTDAGSLTYSVSVAAGVGGGPVYNVASGGGGVYIAPISSESPSILSQGTTPPSAPTSTASIQALIDSLQQQLTVLLQEAGTSQTVESTTESVSSSFTFTRNLSLWDTGSDVQALQNFLISQSTGPAAEKLKTHGSSETFGLLTYDALKEYQASVGIPATGYFGELTRGKLNTLTGF